EDTRDTGKQFDDIKLRLDGIHDLPDGAGPINFIKDFGDTAALMLTVASPRASEAAVRLRSNALQSAIVAASAEAQARSAGPITLAQGVPPAVPVEMLRRVLRAFTEVATHDGLFHDARVLMGPEFIGVDAASDKDDATLVGYVERFARERLQVSEFHPDAWSY